MTINDVVKYKQSFLQAVDRQSGLIPERRGIVTDVYTQDLVRVRWFDGRSRVVSCKSIEVARCD
jgi:hypothetical protein